MEVPNASEATTYCEVRARWREYLFLRIIKPSSASNQHPSKVATSTMSCSETTEQRNIEHYLHRERNTLVLLGCLAEKLGRYPFSAPCPVD